MAGVPEFNKELRGVQFVGYGRYDASKDTTGKVLFTLPKGGIAIPLGWICVTTAFNAGTLAVGRSGATTALWATADAAATTAGLKQQVLATITADATFKAVLAADTDVIATVATAVTGVAIVAQPFLYPYKLADLL